MQTLYWHDRRGGGGRSERRQGSHQRLRANAWAPRVRALLVLGQPLQQPGEQRVDGGALAVQQRLLEAVRLGGGLEVELPQELEHASRTRRRAARRRRRVAAAEAGGRSGLAGAHRCEAGGCAASRVHAEARRSLARARPAAPHRLMVASGASLRRSTLCSSERWPRTRLTSSSSSKGDFSSRAASVSCMPKGGSFSRSTITWMSSAAISPRNGLKSGLKTEPAAGWVGVNFARSPPGTRRAHAAPHQ